MRQKLEEIFLRLVRLYTYNTPLKKGKYRLFLMALEACKEPHTSLYCRSVDGRRFSGNLTSNMQETVFFLGEYEPFLSSVIERLVDKGDTCLDVGANFGWYTSLFAKRCGQGGSVHSFEPTPSSFGELIITYEFMGSPRNVAINNCALGDKAGEMSIHVFDGDPTGHASLAPKEGLRSTTFKCEVKTLDSYLLEKKIDRVDLVKVDIEGAELMFLKGASRLFSGEKLPVIMMEMAKSTSASFGYLPDELIKFLAEHGDYDFYAADEARQRLHKIDHFADDDIGANVFCVSRSDEKNTAIVREYVG